jgi:hypothetical protein
MTNAIESPIPGQAFRDRDGQRWWVRGPRPGHSDQFVVEAQMKGSYPRVAVYAMTEREFREHARSAALTPERGGHREKR